MLNCTASQSKNNNTHAGYLTRGFDTNQTNALFHASKHMYSEVLQHIATQKSLAEDADG
jgi:hypothetical protein